jgi:hypothetical protein
VPADVAPRDAPRVVSTLPAQGAADVDRLTSMHVVFDRPLLPRSVDRESVVVRSGPRTMPITVRADPVLPGLVVQLLGALEPTSRWELRVEGVRDLDGTEAEPLAVVFRTGSGSTPRVPAVPPAWSEIGPLLAASCGPCHGGGDRGALGLDLSSAEGVRATAIGVPALQTGGVSSGSPRVGLVGLPRISVLAGSGAPELSYLVYKLLGDPHVQGERMPPDADAGAAPVSSDDVRRIADWIRAGAPTE